MGPYTGTLKSVVWWRTHIAWTHTKQWHTSEERYIHWGRRWRTHIAWTHSKHCPLHRFPGVGDEGLTWEERYTHWGRWWRTHVGGTHTKLFPLPVSGARWCSKFLQVSLDSDSAFIKKVCVRFLNHLIKNMCIILPDHLIKNMCIILLDHLIKNVCIRLRDQEGVR